MEIKEYFKLLGPGPRLDLRVMEPFHGSWTQLIEIKNFSADYGNISTGHRNISTGRENFSTGHGNFSIGRKNFSIDFENFHWAWTRPMETWKQKIFLLNLY